MEYIQSGLIVSCQAEEGSPFYATPFIVAFAKAAEKAGAVAVRIRSEEHVREVRKAVSIPIIGITKSNFEDGSVLITPTVQDGLALRKAGANVIAADGTLRVRPDGLSGPEFIRRLGIEIDCPIMADIATVEDGIAAMDSGADYIGTTLSGYTPGTAHHSVDNPDYVLVETLSALYPGMVIAEGRIWNPLQANQCFKRGAHAVVVGSALTRPVEAMRHFIRNMGL